MINSNQQGVIYSYKRANKEEVRMVPDLLYEFATAESPRTLEQAKQFRESYCKRYGLDTKEVPIYRLIACVERVEEK